MRKLKLKIDDLRVDSFALHPRAPARSGTVRGNGFNDDPGDVTTDDDIPWYDTWWPGCQPRPTQGTCIGPTYCCAPTWEETCRDSCMCSESRCPV